MNNRHLLFLFCCLFSFTAFSQSCSLSSVYFKSGRHSLTRKHRHQLDSLLSTFSRTEFYLVELHGMTDTTDSRDYNLALAQKRIDAVKEYISASGHEIHFMEKNTGENTGNEGEEALNRRVDIWFVQLTSTKSVILKGELGERIVVPVKEFNNCGYCTTEMKLKSEWKFKKIGPGQTERFLNTTIETSCNHDSIADTVTERQPCTSVELRLPFSLYNKPSELKIPRPLIFSDCCGNRDSISAQYLRNITVGYDTVNLEYIVTVPCYNFYRSCICCGTRRVPCPKALFKFPENFRKLQTYIARADDTLHILQDSLYTYCNDPLTSFGFIDNRFVYLRTHPPGLKKEPVYDSLKLKGPPDYYKITIQEQDYSPLVYSTIRVRIKAGITAEIDSTGFFIDEFSVYLPATQTGKRVFEKPRLESQPFRFLFYSGGETYLLYSSELKTRYNKKKRVLKVKVKKKSLTVPSKIALPLIISG